MINRTQLDKFEEAIEVFEEGWTPQAFGSVRSLMATYGLSGNESALVELIRVDIELRYGKKENVDLDFYFNDFPTLLRSHGSVALIAFEDFRSRTMKGLPIEVSKWENLPGIHSEIWFQQLSWEKSSQVGSQESSRLSFNERPSIDPHSDVPETNATFLTALSAAGFHVVSEIGVGAFSRVYLATQKKLADRYVVLKVVNQLLAEPQRMALLQHTNIVQVHSVHRILSRCVICMPYAGSLTLKEYMSGNKQREGRSLVETVRNKVNSTIVKCGESLGIEPEETFANNQLSPTPAASENAVLKPLEKLTEMKKDEFAIWLFSRLTAALSHAHGRGVMHGDLKPGNVLIRNDGEPALIDFNLARTLGRTEDQHIGGTLAYMSPEAMHAYVVKSDAKLDEQSDIYSLGVMLFEFTTGRLPFDAPKTQADLDVSTTITQRKQSMPAWAATDTVSTGLKCIINRCLEHNVENRYATATELREDLDCEHKGQPLLHAREPFGVLAKKHLQQNSRTMATVAAVLVLASLVPLAQKASEYRSDNLRMNAEAHFHEFAKESANTISQLMANPLRHTKPQVDKVMKPLEKFGILDGSGMQLFEPSPTSPKEKNNQRQTLLRHVIHTAYAEVDRLRPLIRPMPPARRLLSLQSEDLKRLDQLIAAADRIRGDFDSRACKYIRAFRAELAGDDSEDFFLRASETKASTDSEMYLEAIRMLSENDRKEALVILNKLADRDAVPSHLRWTMVGISHFGSDEYEDAIIAFTQSLERAPNTSRLWFLRGICYQRIGKNLRAESDFLRLIELEPKFPMAWLRLGMCCLATNRADEAFEHIGRCLTLSPSNAQALLGRSRAYLRLGMKKESEQDYQEAIRSTNVTASTLTMRGRDMKKVDPQLAIKSFKQSYEIDPYRESNLRLWAKTLSLYLNETEKALEILNITVDFYPENKAAIIDRAVLWSQLGDYENAKQDIARAMGDDNSTLDFYQAACASALIPEPAYQKKALNFLAISIHKGFKADKLDTDPDLASIRETKEFQAIQTSYRLANSR